MTFPLPNKIQLARIPTPLEPLPHLSEEWKADLRVKRDDLTGTVLSGNKIRKLEYLLCDALNHGCDSVVTCGAVTSNHARATAIAARQLGLDCLLVLAGDAPSFPHGNLQLDLLAGAEVRYISKNQYATEIDSIFHQIESELRSAGRCPYMIPTGGSNPVGLMGYVEAVQEIQQQCKDQDWFPDYIVCAVGSGGTYAGLLLGNELYGFQSKILGILVCGSIKDFSDKVLSDVNQASKRCGFQVEINSTNVLMYDNYIGGGYAITNSEQLKFIRHIVQREAIFLDPVYTAKTLFGVHREITKGRIAEGSRILFIHTGGIYGLSAFVGEMMNEWNSVTYWQDNY